MSGNVMELSERKPVVVGAGSSYSFQLIGSGNDAGGNQGDNWSTDHCPYPGFPK